MSLTVRLADITDDAVAISHGSDVVLLLSSWLHPIEQLAVTCWIAEDLAQNPGSRSLRIPTGQVMARTPILADRRLADLMGRRATELGAADHAYAITALLLEHAV